MKQPSEQPANAQASPSPSRQSLESVMDEVFDSFEADYQQSSGSMAFQKAAVRAKTALLKAVNMYVEERELLSRIDELENWRTMVQRLSEYVDSKDSLIEFDDRISALRQQVKGNSND